MKLLPRCAPAVLLLLCCSCLQKADGPLPGSVLTAEDDPPQVTVGERLFLETRFAQFFAAHAAGPNARLLQGDPVLDECATTAAPLPGPFAGGTMNCRACHLVDELAGTPGGGMRSYGDFARRSPIPARADGAELTPRNSPPLVHASTPGPDGVLLHFDAEFASTRELVEATLTGRNYGWLASEQAAAVAHVARIVREDDGSGELAAQFGGFPYRTLLAPPPSSVPAAQYLPPAFRIDVAAASDAEIVSAVARLIAAYVDQLRFDTDPASGAFRASPYDAFLAANALPRVPEAGESPLEYSRRLRTLVEALANPGFVQAGGQSFATHGHPFEFGALELAGLRAFLAEPATLPPAPDELARGGIGNCIACHAAPRFGDVGLHNTGVSQAEYDALHGTGAFLALEVPDLAARESDFESWLPPTPLHPRAHGTLRSIPRADDPAHADLGAWNVFANPDLAGPQAPLRALLCRQFGLDAARTLDAELLPLTLGYFKTPGLRDLGHSAPYFHDGGSDTLEAVLQHYRTASGLARAGTLRNASPELAGIALVPADVAALAAFLRALDEDYQ